MKTFWLIFLFIFLSSTTIISESTPTDTEKQMMVDKINEIRSKGCKCGKKYMPPAPQVTWNDLLYKSALFQAEEISKMKKLTHFSKSGKDIGQRIDFVGYSWSEVGENLAHGQVTFDEAIEDWLKSPTHCTLIMSPKVNEMAVARVGDYWVNHFGHQLTKSTSSHQLLK